MGTPAACAIGATARETLLMTAPMIPMTLSWLMSFWAALAPTSGEPVSSSMTLLIVVLTPLTVAPPAVLNSSTAIARPFLHEEPKVADPPVIGKIPPRLTTWSVGVTAAFLHPTPTPAISAQTRIMASILLIFSPLLMWNVIPVRRVAELHQACRSVDTPFPRKRKDLATYSRRDLLVTAQAEGLGPCSLQIPGRILSGRSKAQPSGTRREHEPNGCDGPRYKTNKES